MIANARMAVRTRAKKTMVNCARWRSLCLGGMGGVVGVGGVVGWEGWEGFSEQEHTLESKWRTVSHLQTTPQTYIDS